MQNSLSNTFNFPATWGRAFVVTLFFVTLSAGLFWLDFFRSYSAEMTVLVVSRLGTSQSGADVAGNLAGLTQTLSFYDRVLAQNDLIDDAFDDYAPDKRKALWNKTVSVRKLEGGSVLALRAKGDTPEAASLLARETAQTLFTVAGFYYNVKTEIDLRIIDGPLVSYVVVKPLLYGTVSLFTGLFVTAFFFLILNAVPGFIVRRKEEISLDEILAKHGASREEYTGLEKSSPEFASDESAPWIDPKKFIPARPVTLSFENITQEAKKSATSSGMRAPAPANLPTAPNEMNLPVMDEAELPFEFEAAPEELNDTLSRSQGEFLDYSPSGEPMVPSEIGAPVSPQDESASPEALRREPTINEYKRRLNNLLSGGN